MEEILDIKDVPLVRLREIAQSMQARNQKTIVIFQYGPMTNGSQSKQGMFTLDEILAEHRRKGAEEFTVEFHTTDKPPVTLPPHCGSVLRIVPKLEEQTMKGKREIERINPYDMSELLNGPADDIIDLLKYEENGESVIEFSRAGERYILDSNVPRRIGVEPMACSDCGNMMIYSGARNKEGLMIYDHPGPCLDKNGNNRFDQEK